MTFPHNKNENGSFSVILGLEEGSPETYHVHQDHPEYDRLWEAAKEEDAETFVKYHTIESKMQEDFEGTHVEIRNGCVYYDETPIDSRLADEIVDLVSEGEPAEHLANFLDKLMDNPSEDSVDQLYNFIQKYGLQITDEGYIIGYKSVRNNYYDHHSNTYNNEVGKTHSMPRKDVDDNPANACSQGFHVGTQKYAENFRNGTRVMVCQVHPKHIVSVPNGHIPSSVQEKIRTSEYKVIGELD